MAHNPNRTVYISDCIRGLIKSSQIGLNVDVFNLGSEQRTSVLEIAREVANEMGFP